MLDPCERVRQKYRIVIYGSNSYTLHTKSNFDISDSEKRLSQYRQEALFLFFHFLGLLSFILSSWPSAANMSMSDLSKRNSTAV